MTALAAAIAKATEALEAVRVLLDPREPLRREVAWLQADFRKREAEEAKNPPQRDSA